VQYCMPYPNDVLAASSHAAVTNARATGDYFHALEQWAIGGTSLFYWAIGVLPFKDGFYSSTAKQIGGQTVGPETHPDREALMSTLSCAMVGPMDGIYLLNASRVMTSCRKDGILLKPDRPLATSDACFLRADPTCHIYHTYTDIPLSGSGVNGVSGSSFRAHYICSNRVEPITSAMLYHPSAARRHFYYNWYTGQAGLFDASNDLAAGYEGTIYTVIAPMLANSWIVLGEISKYVPLARKRISGVAVDGSSVQLTVEGVSGEEVTLCALHCVTDCESGANPSIEKVCQTAHFGSAGEQRVVFAPKPVVEAA